MLPTPEHLPPEQSSAASPFPAAPTLAHNPVLLAHKRSLMRAMFGVELGPRRLAEYVVLGELGAGAMGVVHAAYDERLDRKVAVKRLNPSRDTDLRARWLREAQAMARVTHPNVVSVYEIIEGKSDDEELLIVMEFVEGLTLRAWAQGKLSRAQILAAYAQAGRGLAAVHAAGLVHRDFKPDNAMIDAHGHVRVMDFGLARTIASGAQSQGRAGATPLASTLTQSGALMGTPAYMSPEQLRGEAADSRSDQYNFCVALWEALAGARPFAPHGQLAELASAMASGVPREPDPDADFPPWLRRVITRGLAPDPAARWSSMDALLAAIAADPTQTRRRRALLAAGAGLIAVLLGSGQQHIPRPLAASLASHAAAQRSCEGAAASIDVEWNEARVQQLEQAFERAGEGPAQSFARETWVRTRAQLDGYARTWAKLRRHECEARIHAPAPAQPSPRQRCLDTSLGALQALLEVLEVVDAHELLHVAGATHELPPLARCRNPRADEPGASTSHTPLRTAIHRAKILQATANYDASEALAQELGARAQELGAQALAAEAMVVLGQARFELGDYAGAETALEQGFAAAVGAGHDLAAVQASTALVFELGVAARRSEDAERWAELGELFIARGGLEDSVEHGQALAALAVASSVAGHRPQAVILAQLERARALLERHLGPAHPSLIDVYKYAAQRHTRDDRARAHLYYAHALALLNTALGPRHPHAARLLNQRGSLHLQDGELDAAERAFAEALEIQAGSVGLEHPDVVDTLVLQSSLARRRGRAEAAIELRTRALELAARVSPARVLARRAVPLAVWLIEAERGAEALELWRELLAHEHLDALSRSTLHHTRATIHLALQQQDAAIADFEQAAAIASTQESVRERASAMSSLLELAALVHPPADARAHLDSAERLCLALRAERGPDLRPPECAAEVPMALARAWAREDPARARALALRAREVYLALEMSEELSALELWVEGLD